MAQIEYDTNKLKQLGGIDAQSAVKNFDSYDEYFEQLSAFAEKAKYYLRQYSPETIVSREIERSAFLMDLKRIKSILHSLGIRSPVSTLSELDYEAQQGDANAITSWLDTFYEQMEQMADCIAQSEEKSTRPPKYIVPDIAELEAEIEAELKKSAAVQETEKPLILAVDDKPELLTAVVNMLEDRFKVMAATNGKAVLKLIERHAPRLFLLDIEMPGMDGFELAELIRNNAYFAKTPIIFLTSKNSRDHVLGAIKNGGNDYILKPVNKEMLISKIIQHLGMKE